MSELWQQPAVDLASAIRRRDVSCREVMAAVLDQVERSDAQTNAFALVDPAAALAGADAADRAVASGAPLGPLHGLPVSAKDLIATRGMRTAMGSHAFAENVPTRDAEVVARVRRAGGIVFGKTTTPELACKILTDSPLHGTTRNPWNLDRTPGGSSGGAGVATAMGYGPLALTTDGAGSSRIPAACCGVVGLKPTLGAVPMELAADLFGGISTIGLMARTAADIDLLFGVIKGPCRQDPWTMGGREDAGAARSAAPAPAQGLGGLRVRRAMKFGDHGLDPEVERLTSRALSRMVDAGAVLADEVPQDFDWALDVCRKLIRFNQAARYAPLLAKWSTRFDPVLVRCLEEGLGQTMPELREAMLERTALFRRVQALFEGADVIVTPSFTATPPRADHPADAPWSVAGASARSLRDGWYCYAVPFNPTGHPAISLPCGMAADGMPVGVQIVGPWHGEERLIRIAASLEPGFGWRDQWPPLALRQPSAGTPHG